ncbi:MAG: hypothetical protein HUJ68_03320 [Clostridia bacterium]|nr:hypothetical protein [Clostridia bacterium]
MNQTNVALKFNREEFFSKEWDYLISETSKVFRLTNEETEKLFNNQTARLIATIPFAAHCLLPERTAIAHLGLYLMELKGYQQYCAHLPSDDADIFSRLEPISNFWGGDEKVIKHGMYLLALIMLEGYKKSAKKDIKNGVYNPIAVGVWNYHQIKNDLVNKISKLDTGIFDYILSDGPIEIHWG